MVLHRHRHQARRRQQRHRKHQRRLRPQLKPGGIRQPQDQGLIGPSVRHRAQYNCGKPARVTWRHVSAAEMACPLLRLLAPLQRRDRLRHLASHHLRRRQARSVLLRPRARSWILLALHLILVRVVGAEAGASRALATPAQVVVEPRARHAQPTSRRAFPKLRQTQFTRGHRSRDFRGHQTASQ